METRGFQGKTPLPRSFRRNTRQCGVTGRVKTRTVVSGRLGTGIWLQLVFRYHPWIWEWHDFSHYPVWTAQWGVRWF